MTDSKKWNFLLLALLVTFASACHDPKNSNDDPKPSGNGGGGTVVLGVLVDSVCYDSDDLAYLQEVVDTGGDAQSQTALTFKSHFSKQDRVDWAQDVLEDSASAPLCQKN